MSEEHRKRDHWSVAAQIISVESILARIPPIAFTFPDRDGLVAALATLREHEALVRERDGWKEIAQGHVSTITTLRARLRASREALKKYGTHLPDCEFDPPDTDHPCTCGLFNAAACEE